MLGAFSRASGLVSLDNIEKALKQKLASDAATLNFEVVRSAYEGTTVRKKA
jgi:Pyruvate/2-oxoacid:ferredoxin oxidoreductase gamma subunit